MATNKTTYKNINGVYKLKIIVCNNCGTIMDGEVSSCTVCRDAKLGKLLKRSIWRKIRDFVGL